MFREQHLFELAARAELHRHARESLIWLARDLDARASPQDWNYDCEASPGAAICDLGLRWQLQYATFRDRVRKVARGKLFLPWRHPRGCDGGVRLSKWRRHSGSCHLQKHSFSPSRLAGHDGPRTLAANKIVFLNEKTFLYFFHCLTLECFWLGWVMVASRKSRIPCRKKLERTEKNGEAHVPPTPLL